MVDKIARMRAMIGARPIHLEVDGGVTPDNAGACAAAGADVLVAGSAVFKGGKYSENIAAIRAAAARRRLGQASALTQRNPGRYRVLGLRLLDPTTPLICARRRFIAGRARSFALTGAKRRLHDAAFNTARKGG